MRRGEEGTGEKGTGVKGTGEEGTGEKGTGGKGTGEKGGATQGRITGRANWACAQGPRRPLVPLAILLASVYDRLASVRAFCWSTNNSYRMLFNYILIVKIFLNLLNLNFVLIYLSWTIFINSSILGGALSPGLDVT